MVSYYMEVFYHKFGRVVMRCTSNQGLMDCPFLDEQITGAQYFERACGISSEVERIGY